MMMKRPSTTTSTPYSLFQLVVSYVICGALHEWIHVVVGVYGFGASMTNRSWCKVLWQVFLLREVPLWFHHETEDLETTVFWTRHAGWVGSLGIWACLLVLVACSKSVPREWLLAAGCTALDAVASDLFQWKHSSLLWPRQQFDSAAILFGCGNFGMIFLHHAWFASRTARESSLDCLEQMVNVTMMRGAQSGGVVTFFHDGKKTKSHRVRVVNQKRADLSKGIRRASQPLVPRTKTSSSSFFPMVWSGHTRFATSSKATLDGTHPHQWTPPNHRKVYYDLFHPSTHSNKNSHKETILRQESTDSRGSAPPIAAASSQQPHDLDYTHGASRRAAGRSTTANTNPTAKKTVNKCKVTPTSILVENYITHNGDFDFYTIQGQTYDISVIQQWLVTVLQSPMPSGVDSCAVAGMVDLLRCQGCFALSIRYVLALECVSSTTSPETLTVFPTNEELETLGLVFESVFMEQPDEDMDEMSKEDVRLSLATNMVYQLQLAPNTAALKPIHSFLGDEIADGATIVDAIETGSTLMTFCRQVIDAFFDNDLFFTVETFMKHAKGSFGLVVTSSLDARQQLCMAARGQTMSVAFYPDKGLICYGSEQAAVKAAMETDFPGDLDSLGKSGREVDLDAVRFDLDDLGGEILLLDWSPRVPDTSPVRRSRKHAQEYELMNGRVRAVLHQESKSTTQDRELLHRMTRLSRNPRIKSLPTVPKDPVLADIRDIPQVCKQIQEGWHSNKAATSLNRLTAFNLARCLRQRLNSKKEGKLPSRAIDILVTGCEVSLWTGEQFATDLQKAFPGLHVSSVSSNKLLGLYGQDISIPALGFPYSPKTCHLHDTIVIIVSHSGGTFAPLSCSNLLQFATKNLFVVTSEWDTPIGKQLRAMDSCSDTICQSRTFSTEVGLRPAEPCSLSVAATHQLLTNLFEYISVVILSDPSYRCIAQAVITEQDLKALQTCNERNIEALSNITGATAVYDGALYDIKPTTTKALEDAGMLWSNHVLENAKAYVLCFLYVFGTVISGLPIATAVAYACGLDTTSDWMYLVRVLDAMVYFWLPQINVFLVRLVEGRDLRHRMVGRTVVVADIPWVAQCADAFLSKLFACSYSIAGLNVLSGNPVDHFVHRHTHRVTRGTLLVCGRPDGRLSALSTAETSVCLSVNQASSIQSLGGTCESITIGHNPFQLPLSKQAIFLKRFRPLFLCERLLVESDQKAENEELMSSQQESNANGQRFGRLFSLFRQFQRKSNADLLSASSIHHVDMSINLKVNKRRSPAALFGAYMNIDEGSDVSSENGEDEETDHSVERVISKAIQQKQWTDKSRKLFEAMQPDLNGLISQESFIQGWGKVSDGGPPNEAVESMFLQADETHTGFLDYKEFSKLLNSSAMGEHSLTAPPSHRNEKGIIQLEASTEKYIGEVMRKYNAGKQGRANTTDFLLAKNQHFSQELYETRIASLQRFVSMCVMFHSMGCRVEQFFEKWSLGLLGYRFDRTHSIMRIATTASPVSGSDVRQQIDQLHLLKKVNHAIAVISAAFLAYKQRRNDIQSSSGSSTSME